MSKMSKIIDAMCRDKAPEDTSDNYVYSISAKEAVNDLADHYTADRLQSYREGLRETYEETIRETYYDEFFVKDNHELEDDYFDAFDVKVIIE